MPHQIHRQSPGNRHSDRHTDEDKEKNKTILIGIAAGLAVLIMFWLIGYSEGKKEKQVRDPSDELKEPSTVVGINRDFTESQYGIEMAYVRGGTFMMGCTPEQEGDCYDYEENVRLVTVSDFYIGKHEITQAQWKTVMGGNPSNFKGDNLPVENVSWNDAHEFISKLNAATGREYRLPTDAEWEYAARGGRHPRGYKYSGSNNVGEIAWYEGNSEKMTHPVGTKRANELGIHDMSGNVWEWVSDWLGDSDGEPQTDPKGPDEGTFRVIRGGGWGSYARGVRVSNYYNNAPANYYNILGFRLAMTSQR